MRALILAPGVVSKRDLIDFDDKTQTVSGAAALAAVGRAGFEPLFYAGGFLYIAVDCGNSRTRGIWLDRGTIDGRGVAWVVGGAQEAFAGAGRFGVTHAGPMAALRPFAPSRRRVSLPVSLVAATDPALLCHAQRALSAPGAAVPGLRLHVDATAAGSKWHSSMSLVLAGEPRPWDEVEVAAAVASATMSWHAFKTDEDRQGWLGQMTAMFRPAASWMVRRKTCTITPGFSQQIRTITRDGWPAALYTDGSGAPRPAITTWAQAMSLWREGLLPDCASHHHVDAWLDRAGLTDDLAGIEPAYR